MKILIDKDVKDEEVPEAIHKLLRIIPANSQYEMGWWSRFHKVQMSARLYMHPFHQQTQSLPDVRSDQAVEPHEEDEEDNTEKKSEMFRNMSSNTVWVGYCVLMKSHKHEKGGGNGNTNDAACGDG